ncbi:hypothetical protein GCM10023345_25550 [Acinetobacter kookii]
MQSYKLDWHLIFKYRVEAIAFCIFSSDKKAHQMMGFFIEFKEITLEFPVLHQIQVSPVQ